MLKSKLSFSLVGALLVAGAVCGFAQNKEQEAKLIAVLKSEAPQKEKADACRELARIGTKDAVAPLAALLGDEKLSHMARYGLETIPDPAVDEALRDALGKVKGRLLAGVMGSLGVRRDVKAVEPLSKFLQDQDADVAQAAARALGKIGTASAAKALEASLGSAPANELAFCEGLFRCAEALGAAGQPADALAIYSRLAKVQNIHQVRAGALRGSVLVQGKDGIPTLLQAIRGEDFVLVDAAARTAIEMKDGAVTKAIADELSKLNTDKKILFTQVLGKRGDAEALPALYAAAKSGDKVARIAAIRAIPEIGKASSAAAVISLLADSDVAQAAQEALAGLHGPEVDQAIMAMLDGNDSNQRVVATDLVARRRMASAMPSLVKAASASDAKVRQAALKRVGELGTVENLPVLLDFLAQAKGQQDVDAAESALTTVCTKASQPEACAEPIIKAIAQAQPAQKGALLRVLSAIGGTKALETVRSAVSDSSPEVHSAAIRALGSWESVDAAPHLLDLARTSSDAKDKMLCLRSYLNLASSHTDLPPARRLAMCKDATALVQKPEEKKLFLSTLGSITSADALTLIAPYLDDAAIKDEASAAALTVAEKILKPRQAKVTPNVISTLEKVIKVTGNDALSQRAKALLQQAMAKGGVKPL